MKLCEIDNIVKRVVRRVLNESTLGYVELYMGTDDFKASAKNGIWLTPSFHEASCYGDKLYKFIIDLDLLELADEKNILKYIKKYEKENSYWDLIDYLIAPWGKEWFKHFRNENYFCDGYKFKYENGETYYYLFNDNNSAIVHRERVK